ncbi:MAG: hypothetical protein GW893_06420 [Armatimonadetes bacterium]|nr:hypothetical protein [Armatimonadota bacterium]
MSDHRVDALSDFFFVGYTTISTARVRGEEYLRGNKRLLSKVQEILERS